MRRAKETFGKVWKLLVHEFGTTNYRVAERVGMDHGTLSKLSNGRRGCTQVQALLLGAGLVFTDGELSQLRQQLDVRGSDDGARAMASLLAGTDAHLGIIFDATRIGLSTLRAFKSGALTPAEDELLRIMIALTVRDERLDAINELLEAAGFHVIGPWSEGQAA